MSLWHKLWFDFSNGTLRPLRPKGDSDWSRDDNDLWEDSLPHGEKFFASISISFSHLLTWILSPFERNINIVVENITIKLIDPIIVRPFISIDTIKFIKIADPIQVNNTINILSNILNILLRAPSTATINIISSVVLTLRGPLLAAISINNNITSINVGGPAAPKPSISILRTVNLSIGGPGKFSPVIPIKNIQILIKLLNPFVVNISISSGNPSVVIT